MMSCRRLELRSLRSRSHRLCPLAARLPVVQRVAWSWLLTAGRYQECRLGLDVPLWAPDLGYGVHVLDLVAGLLARAH
jgi:hypothetical protein